MIEQVAITSNHNKVDIKVVMLGQSYSGKSSIVQRYLYNQFHGNDYHTTVGAAYGGSVFKYKKKTVSFPSMF